MGERCTTGGESFHEVAREQEGPDPIPGDDTQYSLDRLGRALGMR
jgi:hypothetical protein